MRRHVSRHPQRPPLRHAVYGWSRDRGFFVDICNREDDSLTNAQVVVAAYDVTRENYSHARPLGALRYLARCSFYTVEDLEEALSRSAIR
jgi:hypothetical protein